ncbi:low-density lipoprotein receptor-related protein 6-like [Mizuhopecten yessoensis]|uniref:low-density lipoprotein receptor-related protein 6-like n=1 Tax=Mizuhopecten yessoensis TaxID=6573 RepID=UPI000B458E59|nr:low-density lipoprotein receptor-related protein 6-like [Mizuhopecten yessoensis]
MTGTFLILFSGFINLAGGGYSALVSGTKANEGSVLFYNGTSWYGMCKDGWDDQDAAVLCRMLGYTGTGASAITYSTASTSLTIWPRKFDCVGNETSLQDCPTSDNDALLCEANVTMKASCSEAPVPNNFFILSFGTAIARMDLTSTSLTLVQSGTVQRAIAVTYDGTNNSVIWTDVSLNQIARCELNGGDITVIYQAGNESVMDGIAIDEDARLIFYTDTGYDQIGVINADTFTRTVLINTNLDEPRAIVLDKNTREIYWTEWGTDAVLEKANYDGSNRQVIVNTALLWPNSLNLDGDVLFWCDAGYDLYEKVFTNGTGRTTLVTIIGGHCFDFTTFEKNIYVNDWGHSQLIRIHNEDGEVSSFGPTLAQRFGIFHHLKAETVDSNDMSTSALTTGVLVGIVLSAIIGTALIVNLTTTL